jgi:hypothetical protein
LVSEQPGQRVDSYLAKSFSVGKQPVLERLLLHREAVEEIPLVESGRLGERRQSRLGRPELELVHVHCHRARIQSGRLAVHH